MEIGSKDKDSIIYCPYLPINLFSMEAKRISPSRICYYKYSKNL